MVFGAKSLFTRLEGQLSENLKSEYPARERETTLRWLLKHIANIKRVDILLDKKVELSDAQHKFLEQAIQRLNQEEPIQYILGECEFYGRRFSVNSNVLIPRQETEELVDLVIREHIQNEKLRIVDIGTGSGCIAITLAKELRNADVWAIDSSAEALEVAERNASYLDAPINFIQEDILLSAPNIELSDIIVSNPPYVLNSESKSMRQNVLRYEPNLALFVEDTDPLLFYRRISELCSQQFISAKWLYLEINERFANKVANLLLENSFSQAYIKTDMQGKERFVIARK